MKELLRRILNAEESGRAAARDRESEARRLREVGRARAAAILALHRENAMREVEEIEEHGRADVAKQRAGIEERSVAETERLLERLGACGTMAMERVIAHLLGEVDEELPWCR